MTVMLPDGETDSGLAAAVLIVRVTVIAFVGPGALRRLMVVVLVPLAAV